MREPAKLSASSLPVRGLDVCWARAQSVSNNITIPTKFIDWWKRELAPGRRARGRRAPLKNQSEIRDTMELSSKGTSTSAISIPAPVAESRHVTASPMPAVPPVTMMLL